MQNKVAIDANVTCDKADEERAVQLFVENWSARLLMAITTKVILLLVVC